MFGQTFSPDDIAVIGILVVLEGVLSVDNALVLGILASRLPKPLQNKALTYGLIGAFVFRFIAIGMATWLLKWNWVKLLGGGYLAYIAIKPLFFPDPPNPPHDPAVPNVKATSFWGTVIAIELTDVAFAVDSILAAIGVVGPPHGNVPNPNIHPKFWVVVTGGMIGVLLMRVAASLFIKLLERFPRFEVAAYLLVGIIGLKLLVDYGAKWLPNPHWVDFHSLSSPATWVFWGLMLACMAVGFIPKRASKQA